MIKSKTSLPFFLWLILVPLSLGIQPANQNIKASENIQIISLIKTPSLADQLRNMGFDLLADWGGKIYIVASAEDLDKLRQSGISYTPETIFSSFAPKTGAFLQGGINGAYHSYKELEADLKSLEQNYPDLAKVYDIGDSLEKRNIYALKISRNAALDEDEAEVLFVGCHHAREWISVEVPYLLGKYLLENYAADADVKRLVDRSEIWIVPLVNPDGLEYTIHVYRYWRKNRRDSGNGHYGIDVNRNYGYKWGFDNEGSSPNLASEIYRGPEPFSEPETKALRDLFLKKNFQAIISYHSFSQVILYPWGYTLEPTDKDVQLKEIAAKMSDLILRVNGRLYEYGQSGKELYLTNGDITDWTFSVSGIPSYTIELPPVDELGGGFFNSEADINSIFQENLPAMLYLIDYSIRHYQPQTDAPSQDWQRASHSTLKNKKKLKEDSAKEISSLP
jgi:murein tripeptide amidase MpaA